MESFNIGSTVMLKSNPEIVMTIEDIDFEENCLCVWLDARGALQKYRFPIGMLSISDPIVLAQLLRERLMKQLGIQ
jgi:hypothetical protein